MASYYREKRVNQRRRDVAYNRIDGFFSLCKCTHFLESMPLICSFKKSSVVFRETHFSVLLFRFRVSVEWRSKLRYSTG